MATMKDNPKTEVLCKIALKIVGTYMELHYDKFHVGNKALKMLPLTVDSSPECF